MKWFRMPRVIGVVVCVYLIAVTVFFWHQTSLRFRFINNAHSVVGEVVALVPRPMVGATRQPNGRTPPLAPVVSYTVDGKTWTYTPDHGTIGTRVRVGDKIVVRYDPTDPSRARIQGEGRLLLPLITAGFGTCAVGVAAVLFLTRSTGRRPHGVRRGRVSVDDRRSGASVAD